MRHRFEVNRVNKLLGRIDLGNPDLAAVGPQGYRPPLVTRSSGRSFDEYGPVSVMADAILDNCDELLRETAGSDSARHNLSAADVIARAWSKHGRASPVHLLGDFVFAVFDQRTQQLSLVRDHIGAKSLYWTRKGPIITFGASIAEVLQAGGLERVIGERSVAEYLAEAGRPVGGTFFQGVHAVPAGSLVEISGSGERTQRWWNPSTHVSIRLPKAADYVDAMRSLVDQAVRDRITDVSKVGAHVSGGIDSTGVGVIADRMLKERGGALAGAYTWSPDVSELYPAMAWHDERQRVVAAAGDVPVRYGAADEHNFLAFLERPMELEGTADLADEIPMLKLAAQDGLDIMLAGWGGDEAFSAHGFSYMAHLILTVQPKRAANFARSQLRTLRKLKPLASLLWSDAIYPLLPNTLYQRFSPYRDYTPNMCFMSADLKQRYRHEIAARREQIRFGPNIGENIKRHLFYGHIGMRMETWAAWARPFGFQYRYPLTDRRILEFTMSIPPEALFMDDRPRGLALAALADALPPNIMKYDVANEKLRETTRHKAWLLIAERTRRGELLQGDCPWLDMAAMRACALNPKPQTEVKNVLEFAELFVAMRVWHMYQRSQQR
jgi:asparagine synthase (glutamine-hydrolysing)